MRIKKMVKSNEFFLFCIIAAICVIFGIVNPAFFSIVNVFDILRSMIEIGIFAMGSLVVMVSGGLDLSFMAIAVFAMHSVVGLFGVNWPEAPMLLLFACGVAIGILLGLFNSVFVAKFRLPAFIVTLGTSYAIKGFCLAIIGSKQNNNIPDAMTAFSKSNLLSIETPLGKANLHVGVLLLAGIVLVTWFLLSKTTLGRSIYCIGGSPASTERIGFRSAAVLMFVYAYAGALAGIGGITHASFQRMSNPFDLVGGELNVIAAVVLGGPRAGGGYGNVTGTVLGVLLITLINNSLVMLRVPTFWQKAVVGLIIILGTTVQIYRYKKSRKA
ncbi:ABC transporter permease [Feifania hominis]|uniref:ABC transporter permease n=1 Tax=Feifania hominis TaxID=2763660 RepID=A0A926HUN1_9FIRM|nr:ABC transporter permease [Feifania hominis]MBC8536120.1 ABC transporter permease [Feifania hominis]